MTIGITMGDPGGVGAGVLLMALAQLDRKKYPKIKIFGDRKLLLERAKTLELSVLNDILLIHIDKTVDFILTGILIGAGIDPVHSLFRWVDEKKKVKKIYSDIAGNQSRK